jgi:hypothetical protein
MVQLSTPHRLDQETERASSTKGVSSKKVQLSTPHRLDREKNRRTGEPSSTKGVSRLMVQLSTTSTAGPMVQLSTPLARGPFEPPKDPNPPLHPLEKAKSILPLVHSLYSITIIVAFVSKDG